MEALNDSSKLVAQALELLRPLAGFAWGDDESASVEIDPIIKLLEDALDKLVNKMS